MTSIVIKMFIWFSCVFGVALLSGINAFNSFNLVVIELLFILLFFCSYFLCIRMSFFVSACYILLYNLSLTLGLFLFYNHFYTPLGFNPVDALFYHNLAGSIAQKDLSGTLNYLRTMDIAPSDWGFLYFQWIIRMLPVEPLLFGKIANSILHFSTSIYLYKTANFLLPQEVTKKIYVVYGLLPVAIFYNASGLKECLFAFCVVMSFYYLYKFNFGRGASSLILSIAFCMLLLFFRTPVAAMLFIPIVFLSYQHICAKYSIVFRWGYLLTILVFAMICVKLFINDFVHYASIDLIYTMRYRSGGDFGPFNLIINIISGVVGPFPTFVQLGNKDNEMLLSVGIFIKIFISYFFLRGVYQIIKFKLRIYYPLLFFVFANILALILTAATLDSRFQYPYLALYFIIVTLGVECSKGDKNVFVSHLYFFVVCFACIVWQLRPV